MKSDRLSISCVIALTLLAPATSVATLPGTLAGERLRAPLSGAVLGSHEAGERLSEKTPVSTPAASPAARFGDIDQVSPHEESGRAPASAVRLEEGDDPKSAARSSAGVEPAESRFRWLGRDRTPLPFRTVEDAEQYLRGARVVAREEIPLGVTRPWQVELERDGVRARAAFRYYHEEAMRRRLEGGETVAHFRDSYLNEIAAFRLARLLGLDNVPPTVARRIENRDGSLQLWVEHAMMEVDRQATGREPPDMVRFNRQLRDMQIFDNLIGNFDRNQSNILVDHDWKVWLIDHTRAFRPAGELPQPADVHSCSRPLWEAIRNLTSNEVEAQLGGVLDRPEIRAVLERRDRIVEILERRIAEHGEKLVIYD